MFNIYLELNIAKTSPSLKNTIKLVIISIFRKIGEYKLNHYVILNGFPVLELVNIF